MELMNWTTKDFVHFFICIFISHKFIILVSDWCKGTKLSKKKININPS